MNDDRAAVKRANFIRLAERRTNTVLEKIRILSNCANTNAYDYSDEDVNAIFSAINEELDTARAKFATTRRREFSLGAERPSPGAAKGVINNERITK
jgi:hypothetical protein